MSRWIRRHGVAGGLLLLAGAASAAGGKTGFSFLASPVETSAAAMAGAVVSRPGDPSALTCNPAGLGMVHEPSIALHSNIGFQDVTQETLSYVRPGAGGAWGLSAGALMVGGLPRTRYDPSSVDSYSSDGNIQAGDQYLGVAFGRGVGRDFAWGAGAKVVREVLASRSGIAAAADAGVLRRTDEFWMFGAAVRDVGTSAKLGSGTVSPPARVQAGAYFTPLEWSQWELDGVLPFQGKPEVLLGAQFKIQESFFRLGYRFQTRKTNLGTIAGASAGFGVAWGDFVLDYALLPFGDLGFDHRVSFSWRPGTSDDHMTVKRRKRVSAD
jgi:hypothetical protein